MTCRGGFGDLRRSKFSTRGRILAPAPMPCWQCRMVYVYFQLEVDTFWGRRCCCVPCIGMGQLGSEALPTALSHIDKPARRQLDDIGMLPQHKSGPCHCCPSFNYTYISVIFAFVYCISFFYYKFSTSAAHSRRPQEKIEERRKGRAKKRKSRVSCPRPRPRLLFNRPFWQAPSPA